LAQAGRCARSRSRPFALSSVDLSRQPLKLGIHRDLPDGLIEPALIKQVFKIYVSNIGYLRNTRLGVARIDLDGEPADIVREVDVKSAQARIAGIRRFKKDMARRRREAASLPAPPVQAPSPPPLPPPPAPASRDGLAALREAASKRRGAA
jgi:sRNA-binding protein